VINIGNTNISKIMGRLNSPETEAVHKLKFFEVNSSLYTVSKKTCYYIFYNNCNNKCPITIIFGKVSSKSMRYRKMVSFPTSPI